MIFPNVKKLKLHLLGMFPLHEPNLDFSQSSSNITSDTEFLPSSIYYQIYKIRHQLEKLSITMNVNIVMRLTGTALHLQFSIKLQALK